MILPFSKSRLLLCIFLAAVSANPEAAASDWEVDRTGTVHHVIDGDTFDASPVGRVRLADIDTPETGQPGAQEATDYLGALVRNRVVYLDVDDLHVTDVYDRLVAVVYVRFNSTYLVNVNKALLNAELADIRDFDNEFDPAKWTLYVHRTPDSSPTIESSERELFSVMGITVVLAAVLAVLVFRWRASKLE